ncbi:MAG: 30S ribosomal protein S9 [Candidatus Diapherotrites archaeon]|nr:30S ribosomal protein S9 [Candidatus Diapherotrites archaeon]
MAKKAQIVTTKAKKKRAVARATLRYPGDGSVRINGFTIDTIKNKYLRMVIEEPLALAGDLAAKVSVEVNVHGGGVMGQAVAARGAIAKALVAVNEDLRDVFMQYDRTLLVDDVRRVEPKKPLGRKARAKKQTSYR